MRTPALRPVFHGAVPAAAGAAVLLLAGCQATPQTPRPPAPAPRASQPEALCYQQLSGPSEAQSIEQLRLERRGGRLVGAYNWIPWQKDRRLGSLAGEEKPAGTARLTYRFQQEGQPAEAPLTIVFDGRQARIQWDPTQPPGQPMPPVLLPRSACAALKPVAKL